MRKRAILPVLTRPGVWVFLAALLLLLAAHGNRLELGTNDEGIYLEGARRMLAGQRPYVDFFGYMTPGSYCVHWLAFWIFGLKMWAGRLPVILYFSLLTACVFGLTRRLAGGTAALLAALLFFAFNTADLSLLTAQHRWDSAALSLFAALLLVEAHASASRMLAAASGFVLAASIIFTPSLAVVFLLSAGWTIARRFWRPLAGWFALGGAAAGTAILMLLIASGLLGPMLQQLLWLSRNYSGVNVMPYGGIIGGYGALFRDVTAFEMPVRLLLVACVSLPAILPPLCLGGWAVAWFSGAAGKLTKFQRESTGYLLVYLAGMVLTTFPRSDVTHLVYISASAYVLAAVLLATCAARRFVLPLTLAAGFLGCIFLFHTISGLTSEVALETPVGRVRVKGSERAAVTSLLARVHPGDTVFVHPYKPLLYFLTLARNPTRYEYLAPGMMKRDDEAKVLADLRRNPPQWVLHLSLSREEYLRVFPNANPDSVSYEGVEQWLSQCYRPAGTAAVSGYKLMTLQRRLEGAISRSSSGGADRTVEPPPQ